MSFLSLLLPILAKLGIEYGPQIEQDIVDMLHKSGYALAQIDAIFAQAKPYDQLGINPKAPVVPETP